MKLTSSAVVALLAATVSAQNPLVNSIAQNVVSGIVAAKTDSDVSDQQATSEIQSVVDIVSANTDIQNLIGSFGSMAMNGVDSSNFPELLSMATATLSAFEQSPDYSKAEEGFKSVLPHYDVPKAKSNVADNLALIINAVTVALPTLTPDHQSEWDAATSQVLQLASSLGLESQQAPSSSAASTTEASSSAAAAPSPSSSGGNAASTVVVVASSNPPPVLVGTGPATVTVGFIPAPSVSSSSPGPVTIVVVPPTSTTPVRSTVTVYATGISAPEGTTIEKPNSSQQQASGAKLYNAKLSSLVVLAGIVVALI